MREIKFKVYDKPLKKMHICGEDTHDSIYFNYKNNKAYYYNLQNGESSVNDNSVYALMEYTGLHDKNGKEIYEGDVVKAFINGIWYIGQVIYEHSGFTIDVTNNKQLEFGRRGIIEIFTEVIGNIYENSDLLKD